MIKKPAEIIQDRMNPSQSRGGLGGLLDYARERNPNTGLSRMQSFAAALDPLIMPEMRAGEAIRERGRERVAAGNVNKTVEWLKNNGYADAAAVIEANPSAASNVVSAILSNRMKPKDAFRIATPEEAKAYGALAGQFDSNGKFYPTQKIEMSEALTSTNKTKAQAMLMSYDSIQNSISAYKDMVDAGGIGVMPGTQRDLLQSARTNLQLQMKDLFELGVLAGPDMDLLNALVFDTTDPKNYLTQALGGGTAEERFKNSIQNLENQMKILIAPKIKALESKPTINNSQANGNSNGFSVTNVVPGK